MVQLENRVVTKNLRGCLEFDKSNVLVRFPPALLRSVSFCPQSLLFLALVQAQLFVPEGRRNASWYATCMSCKVRPLLI